MQRDRNPSSFCAGRGRTTYLNETGTGLNIRDENSIFSDEAIQGIKPSETSGMQKKLTHPKSYRHRVLFVIVSFLISSSCSLEPVVIEPETLGEYFVFCTLTPTLEEQELLLGKTVPENLPVPIANARVIISDDTHSVKLSHVGSGVYRDVDRLLKIRAGIKYSLNIALSHGKTILGETIIPGDFEIIFPSKGDTINHFLTSKLDTSLLCHVRWTQSKAAKFYTLYLEINDKNITSTFINTFRNTAIIPELWPILSTPDSLTGEEIVSARLWVFARDSTFHFIPQGRHFLDFFTDYTEEELQEFYNNSFRQFNRERTNLKGAIGAFCGISSASTEICLKIEFDWP